MSSLSKKTLDAYNVVLKKQIKSLKESYDALDIKNVLEICHKIKGSSALFGNEALGIACREIEVAEQKHDPEYLNQKVAHLLKIAENAASEKVGKDGEGMFLA